MRKLLIYICLLIPLGLSGQTSVTLEDCLRHSQEGNVSLQGGRLDIEAAKARQGEVLWMFFPQVSVSSFGFWARDPLLNVGLSDILGDSRAALVIDKGVQEIAGELELNTSVRALQYGWGVSAMAMQPLFAGGRIISGNRLAEVGTRAAELQYQILQRDNRSTVEEKYWQVVALQEKQKTLTQGRSVLDSLLKAVSAARRGGLIPEHDLTAVRLRQKELDAAEVALKGGIRLAKIDLFQTIGMPFTYRELDSYVCTDSIATLPPPPAMDDAVAEPESRLLELQVQAKKLEKQVQVGEYLPQVGVGLGYGYGHLQGPTQPSTKLLAFATVKIPLTGIGQAVYRARRYEAEVAKAQMDQAFLGAQLLLQQRKFHLEMEIAYEQVRVAREAMVIAADGERRSRADYRAGRIALAEYLKASLDRRTATETYVDKCMAYRKAYNAYCGRYLQEP